mmetsp:Transcript_29761/g.83866  ORF Transcript_29761/g.83866 Transcript_29761/m.83866 type:complete len:154 (-) Transcript_29761:62-523(-)
MLLHPSPSVARADLMKSPHMESEWHLSATFNNGAARSILESDGLSNISICKLVDGRGVAIEQQQELSSCTCTCNKEIDWQSNSMFRRPAMTTDDQTGCSVNCVPVFVCVILLVAGIILGGAAGLVIGTAASMRAMGVSRSHAFEERADSAGAQ